MDEIERQAIAVFPGSVVAKEGMKILVDQSNHIAI
jgi:hypothetical protein